MGVGGIIGIIIGVIVFIVLMVFIYFFVFSKRQVKKQIKELERKYSYLDALLIGQDSQYIHRLEIISRTNLLYVDKHTEFSARFKEIFDHDDKYAESLLKQLNALVANNQYKNIKETLAEARKAVLLFEESANQLDKDLYDIIKLEEESRQVILKLKESYRMVKQNYFTICNDLPLIAPAMSKVFEKLDSHFQAYDNHIESAEYEDAENLLPTIRHVISAIDKTVNILPDLCALVEKIIPTKIVELENTYKDVSSLNIPIYHLSIDKRLIDFNNRLSILKENVRGLAVNGATESLNSIIAEIDECIRLLEKEVQDKAYFEEQSDHVYLKVKDLNDGFMKICAALPKVTEVFVIDETQSENIDRLKHNIDNLWATKRSLDGFIHSETKQPYSILRDKLEKLNGDYELANTGLKDFRAYLDSLKISSEEAYELVHIYFLRNKQMEQILRNIKVDALNEQYDARINDIYGLLNDINSTLKTKPINVALVNEKVEVLKRIANEFFNELDAKYRDCELAESAIVYANRDRHHQTVVNQQLSVSEQSFFEGDFAKVYKDANAIYARVHVEENGITK